MYALGCVHHAYWDPPVSRLMHMLQVACTTPIKTLLWVAFDAMGPRSWPVFPLPRALPVFPPRWAVWSPSRRYRIAVASLSSRSRAPRLLRPSSESPECTGYQIGPRRGALTSSLGRALTSSSRWPWDILIYISSSAFTEIFLTAYRETLIVNLTAI
jgi:hypothetical protein